MRRKRIKSAEEIESDKWITNHNRKIKKSNLTKREKEKQLVPKLNAASFGRSEEKLPVAKKKKKNVDLVQFNRKAKNINTPESEPEAKPVQNKLDVFQTFMETKIKNNEYWMQLVIDLDDARNNLKQI